MTNVLVIDDEAPIRLLCRVNLEAEGMTVSEAADGPSGLEKARADRPDVILLDVMMPGMDGFECCSRLKADPRTAQVPVVFITAKASQRDLDELMKMGAVGTISKPFAPKDLPDQLREIWKKLP